MCGVGTGRRSAGGVRGEAACRPRPAPGGPDPRLPVRRTGSAAVGHGERAGLRNATAGRPSGERPRIHDRLLRSRRALRRTRVARNGPGTSHRGRGGHVFQAGSGLTAPQPLAPLINRPLPAAPCRLARAPECVRGRPTRRDVPLRTWPVAERGGHVIPKCRKFGTGQPHARGVVAAELPGETRSCGHASPAAGRPASGAMNARGRRGSIQAVTGRVGAPGSGPATERSRASWAEAHPLVPWHARDIGDHRPADAVDAPPIRMP